MSTPYGASTSARRTARARSLLVNHPGLHDEQILLIGQNAPVGQRVRLHNSATAGRPAGCPVKVADRAVVGLLASSCGGPDERVTVAPTWGSAAGLESSSPDQGRPLRTVRQPVTAVEIPGGKVSDVVAEHLAERLGPRNGERLGQADHAAIEMDPSQRAAKPPAPLDVHALPEVQEAPPAPPVLERLRCVGVLSVMATGRGTIEMHIPALLHGRDRPLPGAARLKTVTPTRSRMAARLPWAWRRAHRFQPSQSQTARPITSSRSRPRSQGSSSVNKVTHWRHEQGMRVMSVPQNQRVGPKAS